LNVLVGGGGELPSARQQQQHSKENPWLPEVKTLSLCFSSVVFSFALSDFVSAVAANVGVLELALSPD
jgi:hypothetical protein